MLMIAIVMQPTIFIVMIILYSGYSVGRLPSVVVGGGGFHQQFCVALRAICHHSYTIRLFLLCDCGCPQVFHATL